MYVMCFISQHQNTGQNHSIKIANKSFNDVAEFKYLGMTVSNQKDTEQLQG
jgi:hypothetical protein